MHTLVYVFGAPGAGKTTLMRALCDGASLFYEAKEPISHRAFVGANGLFTVLGRDAYPFGGTDTLSYTAVGSAHHWLKLLAACKAGEVVLGEGDRLANARFFETARRHYRVVPVYLACPDAEAARRRADRASHHGLALQSDTWIKGRMTKHANLAARQSECITLDATQPAPQLAADVWRRAYGG